MSANGDESLRCAIADVVDASLCVVREYDLSCDWPSLSVIVRHQNRRTIYECDAIASTLHRYYRECHRRNEVAAVRGADVIKSALSAIRRLVYGDGGKSGGSGVRISKRGHVRVDIVDGVRDGNDGDDSASVRVIAHIRSVFRQKFGCARQGALVPCARGRILLRRELNEESLRGLSAFTHVWIIFLFHANTDADANATVRPPRLNGQRVGAFATRSPHRPSNIGLSAVKLDRVSRSELHVSGVDLIDGTPIVDIKPYHTADIIADARVPSWVHADNPLDVAITRSARADVELSMSASAFYTDAADMFALIRQSIAADPRSFHSRSVDERTADDALPLHECPLYAIALDHLHVTFAMRKRTAIVVHVALATADTARTLRSAEWNAQIRREIKESAQEATIQAEMIRDATATQ